jgi:hypothetical protein
MDMKIIDLADVLKTNPIQTQSKPIKANKMPKQTQNKANTNPNKPNFKLSASKSRMAWLPT